MLIAPLMTPVLGIAASVAMALSDAIARTVFIVVCATVGAIAVSWLIAGVLPGELLTSEVLARTAPDVRDLVVALAAGLAGSYATARPDVSSSLPGVAIAVALVPPLAVVGITMRAGEGALAKGALLLYATNLAAIITVSTVVFVVAGFVPGQRLASMAPRVIAGGLIGVTIVAALAVLLTTRTIETGERAREVAEIRAATDTWLEGSFNQAEVEVDANAVRIRVAGPDEPPPTAELAREITGILREEPDLRVTWFQAETADSLQAAAAAEATVARWQGSQPDIERAVAAWLSTGPEDASYEVTSIEIDANGVLVEVASTVQPPPLEDLAGLVEAEAGEPIPVSRTWRDLSVEAAEAERAEREAIESAARLVAQEWAAGTDIDVVAVTFDGARLIIDLLGTAAPEEAGLERDLTGTVPDGTEIRVYLVPREPVIPAPTATPVPTPTPRPTPTPTPVPTPTPTPGGG